MRLLGRRRGVSTIIANLLIMSIVLSLSTVVFLWAMTSFGQQQGVTSQWFADREEATKESLIMEDVWYNSTNSPYTLYVTVRNVGVIDVNIKATYFNATSRAPSTPSLPQSLLVGSKVTFKYTSTQIPGLTSGKVYYIAVATERGNQVKGYFKT